MKYLLLLLLFACGELKAQEEASLPKCDCREIDSLRNVLDSLGKIRSHYLGLRIKTVGMPWPKEFRDAADLVALRWKKTFMNFIAAKGGMWKYSKHWDGIDMTERTCINECE